MGGLQRKDWSTQSIDSVVTNTKHLAAFRSTDWNINEGLIETIYGSSTGFNRPLPPSKRNKRSGLVKRRITGLKNGIRPGQTNGRQPWQNNGRRPGQMNEKRLWQERAKPVVRPIKRLPIMLTGPPPSSPSIETLLKGSPIIISN